MTIAGMIWISVGAGVGLIILVLIAWCLYKRIKKNYLEDNEKRETPITHHPYISPNNAYFHY